MDVDFEAISENAKRKAIDAITSMWGKGNPEFQEYIKKLLEKEPLFSKPVIQMVYPYIQSSNNFGKCPLFDDKFKQAIANAEGDYKFPLDRQPYEHQWQAWEKTLKNGKSIAVTTGTGSGKTECFMLPVLHDIYKHKESNAVQAIFLYPLNALMGSQKKRIISWTNSVNKYCNTNINFAQYNGKMQEEQKLHRNLCEILDRKTMRQTPPQILFTNPTMLEYMLVRGKDAPILENSKGKLRWIILDEAHTFSGSSAVEMALLIKRVLYAFGVSKEQVRFAATSATVAGVGSHTQLEDFLSKLTGKAKNETEIISGSKTGIDRFEDLKDIGNWKNFPVHLRGHFFERTLPGLLACVNANCNGYAFQGKFSYTLSSKKTLNCPVCGSLMMELVACRNCNQLFLRGSLEEQEIEKKIKTIIKLSELERDDILDLDDNDEDNAQESNPDSRQILFAKKSELLDCYDQYFNIQQNQSKYELNFNPDGLFAKMSRCDYQDSYSRCTCGEILSVKNIKHFGLSAEFLSRMAIPVLLDEMPQSKPLKGDEIYEGKKIMAFTDSRQGTARSVALLNNEVERNFIRTAVYHTLCSLSTPMAWNDLRDSICNDYSRDLGNLMNHIKRNEDIKLVDYVESLMADQFLFIPKNSNSLETLGLVNVIYAQLCSCKKPSLVALKDDSEWRNFLKIFLDYYVRQMQAINIRPDLDNNLFLMHYHKGTIKENKLPLLATKNPSRIAAILCASLNVIDFLNKAEQNKINLIITKAFEQLKDLGLLRGDNDNGYAMNVSNLSFELTQQASICPVTNNYISINLRGYSPWIKGSNFKKFKIKPDKLNLKIPKFPYTKRQHVNKDEDILSWIDTDGGWKKLKELGAWSDLTERILLYKKIFLAAEHSAQQSDSKLRRFEEEFEHNRLNILGCSTTMEMGVDIGGISGILMNTVPPKPANYMQRAGRAGRRKEPPRSIAYTMCAATPIGEQVMEDPRDAIFNRTISPPNIDFNSDKILQRHINSFLFGIYVRKSMPQQTPGGISVREQANYFFESLPQVARSYAEDFIDWLLGLDKNILDKIENLFNIKPANAYVEKIIDNIQKIATDYQNKLEYLKRELKDKGELDIKGEPQSMAGKAINREIWRLQNNNLIKFLVEKEFLPGAGIPTGVVEFDNEYISDLKQNAKDDLPSRDIAVALREYAPGNTVVINGWAYKSAGILMGSQFSTTNMQQIRQCTKCGNQYFVNTINYDKPCECGENENIGLTNTGSSESKILEPVGYAVDIYGKSRRNIQKDAYVPIREPLLINMELWDKNQKPFYDVRKSDENLVAEILYYDKGAGFGYAVCLRCGRTVKEIGLPSDPQNELMRGFLHEHKRLRGGRERGQVISMCEGNENSGIERNIVLAGRIQTDICEIRLGNFKGVGYSQDKILLRTFATALKNEFVKELGIEQSEVNFNIKNNRINDKTFISAFFFDSVKGGAGYSTQLADQDMMDFLILKLIDAFVKSPCSCKKACQKCLINKESQWHMEELDRNVLIEWLKNYDMHTKELPVNLKNIDKDMQMVKTDLLLSLKNLCIRESVKGITLFVNVVDCKALDLNNAKVTAFLGEQKLKGKQINFKICNYQRKKDLIGEAIQQAELKSRAYIKTISEMPLLNGCFMPVVLIECDNKSIIYGVETSNDAVFYRSEVVQIPLIQENDLENVKLEPNKEAVFEIKIPGKIISISKFGETLFALYKNKLSDIESLIAGKNTTITYSDRYLNSPFGAMLLFEVIEYIKKTAKSVSKVTIKTESITNLGNGYGMSIRSNWPSDDRKTEFMESLIENCQVEIGHPEHDRHLTINAEGKTVKIYFLAGIENNWSERNSLNFRHNDKIENLIQNYHAKRKSISVEQVGIINHAIKIQ